MVVFKFGGASVKDASGIVNLANIVAATAEDVIVVVSRESSKLRVIPPWADLMTMC